MLKDKKYPAEVLTPSEVNQLIAKCSRRCASGLRSRALITVLYRSGLRLGETLALRPKEIDAEAATIRVLHGKGDKARTVSMDQQAFAILDHWIHARAKLGINGTSPIFCTLRGQSIHQAQIRELFTNLAHKCGILKRVHAHCLRHTFAAELMKENTPLNVIKQALGHANIATTSLYVSHLNPTDVISTMQAREWAVV